MLQYGIYIRTHCLPDCKRRGKLLEKGVRIPGTGNVFLYSILFRRTQAWCMGLTVNQRLVEIVTQIRSQVFLGAAEGCGSALQVECLEGFDTPGLHQVYAGFI